MMELASSMGDSAKETKLMRWETEMGRHRKRGEHVDAMGGIMRRRRRCKVRECGRER